MKQRRFYTENFKVKVMSADNIKIEDYCKDIYEWPESWEILPEDIAYGQEILKEIIKFIKFLILKNYTQKTLKKHIDNLWLLGGELIGRINSDEELRNLRAKDLLLKNIDSSGGPYSRHLDSEYAFNSFDSTCKKLYKYIK